MDTASSWNSIVEWCRANAPATAAAIRPPASAALLAQVEADTAGIWPAELRTLYSLADGSERGAAGYLLPNYCLLPLESVREHWSMWQVIAADIEQLRVSHENDPEAMLLASLDDQQRLITVEDYEQQPAGTPAGLFLRSYVPIAEDLSGADIFVDTRPGALHGCVGEFLKGEADSRGPRCTSIAGMLADVVEALHTGRPRGIFSPVATNGLLTWQVVD